MRDWEVGDPADWGDNVGVPDMPYMGYLREDEDDEYEEEEELTLNQALGKLVSRIYGTRSEQLRLALKTKYFIESGWHLDSVYRSVPECIFRFFRESQYFTSTLECIYVQGIREEDGRIFEDCEIESNFGRLFQNESFKAAVAEVERKNSFKFEDCYGGYGVYLLHDANDDFGVHETDVTAIFRNGDGEEVFYDVDLENMVLKRC